MALPLLNCSRCAAPEKKREVTRKPISYAAWLFALALRQRVDACREVVFAAVFADELPDARQDAFPDAPPAALCARAHGQPAHDIVRNPGS